jgi:hypothetical protein
MYSPKAFPINIICGNGIVFAKSVKVMSSGHHKTDKRKFVVTSFLGLASFIWGVIYLQNLTDAHCEYITPDEDGK